MIATKWIVTSKATLQDKYGKSFSKIGTLINKLIAADKKRGLATGLLYIDDAQSAKAAGIKAVKTASAKDCKAAIDALYKKQVPNYIVILGAQDVFPFQMIENPATDDDRDVPSDLPYACEHPYSRNIADFTGPTRVVGRIPDVPGVGDIAYLTRLINNVIAHKPIKDEFYRKYFAVSAEVWQKSTETSMQAMFGEHKGLLLSPKAAPAGGYPGKLLSPLAHFYNCHGALGDTRYFGQRGDTYPVALDANNLTNNIAGGTVVAAECCYGAELINPADSADGKTMSISNTYLGHDALAFVGSSTIAYGPSEGQGQADLITQYFLVNIMNGASTGRAFLEARQKFLSVSGPHLDPIDLKTLAQFYLLGDPSITPVEGNAVAVPGKELGNTVRNRRQNLIMKGLNLANTVAAAKKVDQHDAAPASPKSRQSATQAKAVKDKDAVDINKLLKETGFAEADHKELYTVANPVTGTNAFTKGMLNANTRFRTFTKKRKVEVHAHESGTGGLQKAIINRDSVLVVKEDDQSILRWRVYVSR